MDVYRRRRQIATGRPLSLHAMDALLRTPHVRTRRRGTLFYPDRRRANESKPTMGTNNPVSNLSEHISSPAHARLRTYRGTSGVGTILANGRSNGFAQFGQTACHRVVDQAIADTHTQPAQERRVHAEGEDQPLTVLLGDGLA